MQRLTVYLATALAAAALTWWLVALPRIELAEFGRATASAEVAELQKLDEQRVELIRDQQLQILDITENERRNRDLLQTISSQSRAQSRAIQELKRNDETIAEYLRGPVPADIGWLYQRTATTNPSAYRQQTEVRTGPVPAASKASTTD